MQNSTTEYQAHRVRYQEVPPDGLLLNTDDVLSILGTEAEAGTHLASPCLDLASATRLAFAHDTDFAEWLLETFAGYSLETLVRPADCAWEN